MTNRSGSWGTLNLGMVSSTPSTQSPSPFTPRSRMWRAPTASKLGTHSSFENQPFLKSDTVMAMFGYKNRSSFWQFVRCRGVPHVRITPKKIMFEAPALEDWINHRRSDRHFR
jgi:predicted DNA-binding transcriptional regulator AlpA